LGVITDASEKASALIERIKNEFKSVVRLEPQSTLYLIWKNPWMGAASGTFIHEVIHLSGLVNCINRQTRYPELNTEQIQRLDPELVLLSSEPYPFREKHIVELQQLCPDAKILLVDGEMFSWYGSRLLKFPVYLENLRKALS
jgi:ABC-type Fe3+-hydroxamate transport system substrate-binding protein